MIVSLMRCYVGVDGGGSKTTVAVSDPAGLIIGNGIGGPSNYNATGIDVAAERVLSALNEAVREAGASVEVAGLCLALAGVARSEDDAAWRGAVGRWIAEGAAGVTWAIRAEDAVITHDAMAALVGGTGKREGVVVIAGTGAIAFGLNAQGDQRRASGWGYLLGDEGSGYWIGLEGLRAVCRADDGRGPATALTTQMLTACGLSRPQDLVRLIYSEWKPVDVAALAPIVVSAGDGGDPVAAGIVDAAVEQLSRAVIAVMRGLGLADEPVEVVAAGGLWGVGPMFRHRFLRQMSHSMPLATVIDPRNEPVIGALLLARGAV